MGMSSVTGSLTLGGEGCQDMIFLKFLSRPIRRSFLERFPFHFTNVSFMTLTTSQITNKTDLLWKMLIVCRTKRGSLNDLLLNGVLCYLPLRILLILNQPTAVQQSIEAIPQFIGDRQPLIEG